MNISELSENYGISKQRISAILRSTSIQPKTAGKLANALGVDVTKIIEEED